MRTTTQKVRWFLHDHPKIFVNDPAYRLATLRYAPEMGEVIWEVKRALKKGIMPEKCEDATSPTFFLKGEDEKPIAVFKLSYYLKEYASYRLDHKGFAGIPPTVITTLSHPLFGGEVEGSCQLYVSDSVSVAHLSSNDYDVFSNHSVRRMAQLDIRLINEDRNDSNMLVKDKTEVIPIDHGFTMPSELDAVHYSWAEWKQAGTPFSEEERDYIFNLDLEKDRAFLIEEIGIEEKIANRLYVAAQLLKLGVIHGFNPNQIGSIMIKDSNSDYPPYFEVLIQRLIGREAREWTIFTKYVTEEIETILEEYAAYQHKDLSIFG